MIHCIICEKHPAKTNGWCGNCAQKIASMSNGNGNGNHKPRYYLTYRGIVVGLYPNGGDSLKARLSGKSVEGLPKGITLDLNTYLDGYTRQQIKAFKAACLKLARV